MQIFSFFDKGDSRNMFELYCPASISKAALYLMPLLRRFGRPGHCHLLLRQDQIGRELGLLPGDHIIYYI